MAKDMSKYAGLWVERNVWNPHTDKKQHILMRTVRNCGLDAILYDNIGAKTERNWRLQMMYIFGARLDVIDFFTEQDALDYVQNLHIKERERWLKREQNKESV